MYLRLPVPLSLHTHNAILHTETQLVLEVWSLNENCGYRRAAYDVQLHLHLIFQALMEINTTCDYITEYIHTCTVLLHWEYNNRIARLNCLFNHFIDCPVVFS